MRIANLLIFLLLSSGFAPLESFAQTASNRWALGLGGGVASYQAFPNAGPEITPMFDPVYSFSAIRYLRSGFDFRTQIAASPQVRFPMYDTQSMTSSWMDMSYQLLFKFNNGIFLREQSFIGPYMVLGIGGSYIENMPDAYVPLGGGIRFRLSSRYSIRVETVKKLSLNKQPQQLNHMIAFVYNLKEETKTQTPDTEDWNNTNGVLALIPQDMDQDGIADIEDNCPEKAGLAVLDGCPENDTVSTIFVQANDSALPTIDPFLNLEESMPQTQEEAYAYHPEMGVQQAAAMSKSKLNEPVGEMGSLADLEYAPTQSHLSDLTNAYEQKETKTRTRRPEIDLSPCGEYVGEQALQTPILFDLDSDELAPEVLEKLDYIAGAMEACSEITLMLNGHADASGEENTNLVLSIMRAYNVKYYLVYHHGISQHRIISAGLGESKPVADNTNSIGREQNRRVGMQFVF